MPGRHLPLLAAAALVTAAVSVAQPQTTDPGPTTTGSAGSTGDQGATSAERDQSTGGAAGGATAGAPQDTTAGSTSSSTTAARMGALQGQDAEFLRRAVESDRLEIASAQAALSNAQRSETKAAARMLLEDHQASSQKLQQLASRKGWSMPAGVTSADADQARMTAAGADFDARFTAEQVRMHRDAIALFRQQAASGSDPDLRQFASDQLPHLEHHLEMLQGAHTQK